MSGEAPQLQLRLPAKPQGAQVNDTPATAKRRIDPVRSEKSDLADAELLAAVLGPSTAPLCERLRTSHDSWRTIAALTEAELLEHGFTTRAVHRLTAIFEIAKRYGETEWPMGAAFRGSADIYAHFRERLGSEPVELSRARTVAPLGVAMIR